MNFAAATGHRLGRATPCLRDTPQRKLMGTTGRRSTYRRRNAVQANPATSVGGSTATTHMQSAQAQGLQVRRS